MDEATKLIARKREIPVVHHDEENCLVQHQIWEGNRVALNICEVRVLDVYPEQFIDYLKKNMATVPHHSKKVKVTPIDWDGDFQIVH